jgi:hypothetical protein
VTEILLCFSNSEEIRIMKFFSEKGVRVKVQKKFEGVETASLLVVDNHNLAVVLDWQCEESARFLTEVSKQ